MKDNRIKEEMEEEIVCNRWKDLADCLLIMEIFNTIRYQKREKNNY